jgi:hypothetical protein
VLAAFFYLKKSKFNVALEYAVQQINESMDILYAANIIMFKVWQQIIFRHINQSNGFITQ